MILVQIMGSSSRTAPLRSCCPVCICPSTSPGIQSFPSPGTVSAAAYFFSLSSSGRMSRILPLSMIMDIFSFTSNFCVRQAVFLMAISQSLFFFMISPFVSVTQTINLETFFSHFFQMDITYISHSLTIIYNIESISLS